MLLFWLLFSSYLLSVLDVGKGKEFEVYFTIVSITLLCVIHLLTNSGSSFAKKKKLVDNTEEEDGGGYTEVAVVDNPLYAENEGEVAAYLNEELENDEAEADHEVVRLQLYKLAISRVHCHKSLLNT